VAATHLLGRPDVEMSLDVAFSARVTRLVAVSSVALGAITWLAFDAVGGSWGAALLLAISWLTMPPILAVSLNAPRLRYLLVVPAVCAAVGLPATALAADAPTIAMMGWWLTTAGVWLGALLGTWLWFRMAPVPRALDHPFSPARWALIGLHVALFS
jgi:hypothetical protein